MVSGVLLQLWQNIPADPQRGFVCGIARPWKRWSFIPVHIGQLLDSLQSNLRCIEVTSGVFLALSQNGVFSEKNIFRKHEKNPRGHSSAKQGLTAERPAVVHYELEWKSNVFHVTQYSKQTHPADQLQYYGKAGAKPQRPPLQSKATLDCRVVSSGSKWTGM